MTRAAEPVVQAVAKPSTIAIVVGSVEEGNLAVGTGVLFACADQAFIITASHVVRADLVKDWVPLVPCPDGSCVALRHCQMLATSTDGEYESDLFDVAVISLRPDDAAALRAGGFAFLRIPSLDVRFRPTMGLGGVPDHILLIYGFPAARADFDGTDKRLRLDPQGVFLRSGDPSELTRFDPRAHLALDYPDPESPAMYNRIGERAHPLRPEGFSGCGVWALPTERFGSWEPQDLKLVGVMLSWLEPSGPARSTKIGVALSILAAGFPHLRIAMRLEAPPSLWHPSDGDG